MRKQIQTAFHDDPLETLLTIPDVAKILRVSRRQVYNLIGNGLPIIKFGKSVRFHPADIRRWLNSGRAA